MRKEVTWSGACLASMAFYFALEHAGVAAQNEPPRAPGESLEERQDSSWKVTLEGFVLAPDGSPAEGAVVVSSAGGKAVTDVAGSYRLEFEVPLETTSVQITAMGRVGGSPAASTSAALSWAARTTRVPPLQLALGGSCSPSWVPTFGCRPGTDHIDPVRALAVYDDGSGPALHAGGDFTIAGGVTANRIAKWDGTRWAALGSGMSGVNDEVHALAVYDDGGGPALYVAGHFLTAGGVSASNIARWDGSSWSALGSGISGGTGTVSALAVFDDGSGPALYAGGYFTTAGGGAASRVAKWNGASWAALGSGTAGGVNALAVHDDGSGPALYAGGSFTTAGGVAANRVAKWNGASWTALGSGTDNIVNALAVHDDGSGPALFAGGDFTTAGGVAASKIAKWDGASWAALGSGMSGGGFPRVRALAEYDDGSGSALYAGGEFTSAGGLTARRIAKWDGASWAALGSTALGDSLSRVHAVAGHDDGGGPALFAAGSFETVGSVVVNSIARWDGSSWSPLGSGPSGQVSALTAHDDGGGPALYAGGSFKSAGGVATDNIAKWIGSGWSPIGSGVNGSIQALAEYDDGGGPALYAAGSFTVAGGMAANRIAKWDGSSWAALGGGMNDQVVALAVHDDGGGPALFAGGSFTTAGGVPASRIAKWDGSGWAALGSGLSGSVFSLAEYDDGGGPALYAGGGFLMAGGLPADHIAKWNGSSWSALGSGLSGFVLALGVYDDGGGPALYAGGLFKSAGGVAANHVAKWDGASWSPLAGGVDGSVTALAMHDDGSGPALYAGGTFATADGLSASHIARWNGSSWSALGSGTNGTVLALVERNDGGSVLCAGGSFTSAFDSGDSYVAEWGCPDFVPPVITCPPPLRVPDRLLDGQEVVHFTVTATDAIDPAPVVVCTPSSGSTFPLGTTLVTCTATDAQGNQSTCAFPVTVTFQVRRR